MLRIGWIYEVSLMGIGVSCSIIHIIAQTIGECVIPYKAPQTWAMIWRNWLALLNQYSLLRSSRLRLLVRVRALSWRSHCLFRGIRGRWQKCLMTGFYVFQQFSAEKFGMRQGLNRFGIQYFGDFPLAHSVSRIWTKSVDNGDHSNKFKIEWHKRVSDKL